MHTANFILLILFRLLVDGDMMGANTDRKFRYALREEDEVAVENEEGEDDGEEEEQDAEVEAAHLKRINAMKFRMEEEVRVVIEIINQV